MEVKLIWASIICACMSVLDGVLPRATVASILDKIFSKQFVVVKRNEKRVQKLDARGYTPKKAGNRV